MAPQFVPGLDLARDFYGAAVRPLLHEEFPRLEYAAALLGPGSDVVGFDTERSTDHDWGPRLQVYLADGEAERYAASITAVLAGRLPGEFRGYPVRFPVTREPDGTARHRVEVAGLGARLTGWLGFDPRAAVTLLDWLATPTQRLAELTTGEVFHDGPGELTRARENTAWYPDDVWRYVLACQWQRVDQEEPFPGRCAEAGDDLGSRIVTARLARDLMRLCLLMHRRYPPYSKWLGRAFAQVPDSLGPTGELGAELGAALAAGGWPARERHLSRAFVIAAEAHNRLGLTEPLDPATRLYYTRPYQVLDAGRFAAALTGVITDPVLRARPPVGAASQFLDSTPALGEPRYPRAVIAAS
ncbi:MAG: hypothetical protein QOH87_2261 [Trebonia sp.]|nr:hypothetical protein [Trebonia sp.]